MSKGKTPRRITSMIWNPCHESRQIIDQSVENFNSSRQGDYYLLLRQFFTLTDFTFSSPQCALRNLKSHYRYQISFSFNVRKTVRVGLLQQGPEQKWIHIDNQNCQNSCSATKPVDEKGLFIWLEVLIIEAYFLNTHT